MNLQTYIESQGFVRVKLHSTKTNHLVLKVAINGCKGNFILDTGASSSCVGLAFVDDFKLTTQVSNIKAASASETNLATKISTHNKLKINAWKKDKQKLIVLDLSTVNEALEHYGVKKVQGIIGADILKTGQAVIDYAKKYVYLK